MIESIRIKDYALIDDLTVEFKPGLNIFTGSTGAGKTIIVGALSLALGERAVEESIRTGADESVIEAAIIPPNDLKTQLAEYSNGENLLIRREIRKNGRSRISLNDKQVTLSTLKEIGLLIADITGQHRQKGLTDPYSHLEIIDKYADAGRDVSELKNLYTQYVGLKSEFDKLSRKREQVIAEKELLEFQVREIETASLKEGEDDELEKEKLKLINAEFIKTACQNCQNILFNDDGAAAERIQAAIKELARTVKFSIQAGNLTKKLEELSINLNETASGLRDLEEDFEFDQGRLEIIEDRLQLIKKLKRKYGQTITEIYQFGQQAEQRLANYTDLDSRLNELKQKTKECRQTLSAKAVELSAKRQEASIRLEKDVVKHLGELALTGALFKVNFSAKPDDMGAYLVNGRSIAGDDRGFDIAEFLICPNPGEQLKPLASTASGGELSRILLAIVSSTADAFPRDTLVFDEIDSGISGNVAAQVGKKLQVLAKTKQVICITHLQQIASRGEAHFKVYKGKNQGRIVTRVKQLDGDQRVEEIARLLAGEKISDIALDSAAELLEEGRS